jgi:hypothetical protein
VQKKKNKKKKKKRNGLGLVSGPTVTNILTHAPNLALFFY